MEILVHSRFLRGGARPELCAQGPRLPGSRPPVPQSPSLILDVDFLASP